MLKRSALTIALVLSAVIGCAAQTAKPSPERIMVLPFENSSGLAEHNWVGESFAVALTDLCRAFGIPVVANEERKVIQQRLNLPLSVLPSRAAAIKMAGEGRARVLVTGSYRVAQEEGGQAETLTVTLRLVRIGGGGSGEGSGAGGSTDPTLRDALANLQTVQGRIAHEILRQLGAQADYSEKKLIDRAVGVPATAFEAYVKGLLAERPDVRTREAYFMNAMRIYTREKKGEVYEEAALELGHVYLDQSKFPEALDYFSRVGDDTRSYPEAAFYSGLTIFRQALLNNSRKEMLESAIAVLRPLADKLGITSVLNTLGAASLQLSRIERKGNDPKSAPLIEESVAYLSRAVKSAPDDLNARFNLALAFFTSGRYAESIDHFREVAAARPQDGEASFLLAKALEMTGDASAASVDDQSRRLLTDNNRYAKLQDEWLKTKLTDTVGVRVVHPARRDFVSMVIDFSTSRSEPVPTDETERLLRQARAQFEAKEFDETMGTLRKILSQDPTSAEAYYLQAMVFLQREETDRAIKSLETSTFWNDKSETAFEAFARLIEIHVSRNECQLAANHLERASKIEAKKEQLPGLRRRLERCATK